MTRYLTRYVFSHDDWRIEHYSIWGLILRSMLFTIDISQQECTSNMKYSSIIHRQRESILREVSAHARYFVDDTFNSRAVYSNYYLLLSFQSERTLLKKVANNFSTSQLEVNKGQALIINNPNKRNLFLVQLVLPDSLSISNICSRSNY